jgi:hypothetical protein
MAQGQEGKIVIGIDISKSKVDLGLLRDGKLKHKTFPNNGVVDYMVDYMDTHPKSFSILYS